MVKHKPKYTATVKTQNGYLLTIKKGIKFLDMESKVKTYLEIHYPYCEVIEIKENK